MADSMSFDFSELDQLAADLGEVPKNAGRYINSAIQGTSKKVSDGARKKVSGRKHFKQAAGAIDYEVTVFQGFGASVIKSEIGYDKERNAGELGNLIEFGAPGAPNALTPGNELITSMDEQQQDFVDGLQKAGADALNAVAVDASVTRSAGAVIRGSYS